MIHLLITGGTLDKDYDALSGELTFPGTIVPHMLERARVTLPVTTTVLMQKDSLEMTDADRLRIAEAAEASEHERLVITHGTDTMTETGRLLSTRPVLKKKTIVLTGAMRPHRLGHSDALFNLGAALMAAQLAQPGVWIAMNGRLLPATTAQKDRSRGV
ncbi:asparaginase domain-containing protein, partial [Sulfurivirga sp.]|uniref:asparaginase domain-containing protein n=1 Tax=Sulfurivirga sp. TaxID=2614236 RepID=UPI0025DB8916